MRYEVSVDVQFNIEVEAENEQDAREEAYEKIADALAPWNMPDHNIGHPDIMDTYY